MAAYLLQVIKPEAGQSVPVMDIDPANVSLHDLVQQSIQSFSVIVQSGCDIGPHSQLMRIMESGVRTDLLDLPVEVAPGLLLVCGYSGIDGILSFVAAVVDEQTGRSKRLFQRIPGDHPSSGLCAYAFELPLVAVALDGADVDIEHLGGLSWFAEVLDQR